MSKKLMIIISSGVAAVFLIMVATLFVLWTKISSIDQKMKKKSDQEMAENVDENTIETMMGPLYSMDTLIVNLADEGGKRYLRVTMDLEVAEEKVIEEVKGRLPQIKHSILMILPTRYVDEINTVDGKIELREELLEKMNSFLEPGSIKNIYFTEFVIQ